MNTLSNWMPWLLAFTLTFIIASLVSGVTYWLARLPSTAMLWVRRVSSAIASLAMLLIFVTMLGSFEPVFALCALLAVVVASGVQTAMEANIDGGALEKKHQFARSFFSYLCSASLVYLLLIVLVVVITRSGPTAGPASSVLSWDIMAGTWGLIVGLVLAPLSISFCRWMFQSLRLRPGIDRTLREDDLAS